MRPPITYGAAGLALVAAVFQFFFRYEYIHTAGVRITRIDRVTGQSCQLPCAPATPRPTPIPSYDDLLREARANALALAKSAGSEYETDASASQKWQITDTDTPNPRAQSMPMPFAAVPTTFVVCYCAADTSG
jgi:hypothetical protein